MSKSTKIPIVKDVGFMKNFYHRIIRRKINQNLKQIKNIDDVDGVCLPEPKTIIGDYDYCDWIYDMRNEDDDCEFKIKSMRK